MLLCAFSGLQSSDGHYRRGLEMLCQHFIFSCRWRLYQQLQNQGTLCGYGHVDGCEPHSQALCLPSSQPWEQGCKITFKVFDHFKLIFCFMGHFPFLATSIGSNLRNFMLLHKCLQQKIQLGHAHCKPLSTTSLNSTKQTSEPFWQGIM